MCYPRIDSPTIFGALLDAERGGSFRIAPAFDAPRVKQMYLPETNVLVTRFMSPDAVCEVLDFMPLIARRRRRAELRRAHGAVGVRARVDDDALRAALRLRARRPHGDARRRRARRPVSSRPTAPAPPLTLRSTVAALDRRQRRRRPLRSRRRRNGVLRARRAVGAARPRPAVRRGARRNRRVLARVGGAIDVSRPLSRSRDALRAAAEAAEFARTRRDRRGADLRPAGDAARRPPLGLPLHVDPRRRVLRLRAVAARLHRRGAAFRALDRRAQPALSLRRIVPRHVRGRWRGAARGKRRSARCTEAASSRRSSATRRATRCSSMSTAR